MGPILTVSDRRLNKIKYLSLLLLSEVVSLILLQCFDKSSSIAIDSYKIAILLS